MRVLLLVHGRQVETVQASPLVRTIVAGVPEVSVTVACAPVAADLARALEGVETVLPLTALDPSAGPAAWLACWARVRRRRFDAAMVCGTAASVRLLAYLAGIPRRVGPSGGLTTLLLSDRVTRRPGENRAATWLRCARALGITAERHLPRLDPGPAAAREALVQLHSSAIADGRLLVALAPGNAHSDVAQGRHSATAWAPERWAHLANQLAVRHGAGIVFVGSAEDERAVSAASVDVDAPHIDVTGQLDAMGIAALLSHCDLVVCGDSPLLHLAAAVGTPTVGLFGPTDGRSRGPYGAEHRVIQALTPSRAHHRGPTADSLMARIRVEDVLAGIESSL